MQCSVLLFSVLISLVIWTGNAVAAPGVEYFVPEGSAKNVRQVQARFTDPMVAFGTPRLPDPFINDLPVAAAGRWLDERTWVADLARPLPGGLRATFLLLPEVRTLAGARLSAPASFSFDTGGPAILRSLPDEGEQDIDEQQVFVLLLDGAVQQEGLAGHIWFEVEGIGERLEVEILDGEERARVLASGIQRQHGWFFEDAGDDVADRLLLLRCRRMLPPASEVRLVWGAGLSSPGGVAVTQDQTLRFRTRPAFTASFQCTRVNAQAQCVPFLPMEVVFSAPVTLAQARSVRLRDSLGREYPMESPAPEAAPVVERLRFPGPFPEKTAFRLELSPVLVDDGGRRLENAAHFPLAVATDEYPPLAKFSGDFGIVELNEGGVLPVTLRNLEARLAGRKVHHGRAGDKEIPGRMARISQDREIFSWLQKVRQVGRENYVEESSADGSRRWRNRTGSASIFGPGDQAAPFVVPRGGDAREFEVVGIPLEEPGLHVVELASPRLGAALLGETRPRYVATAALVTNMAVHFKWGRESSLVWVTTLDKAQPVAEADIRISDACTGGELWRGKSGGDGTVRLDGSALPDPHDARDCSGWSSKHPLLVSARTARDMSFTLSGWSRGIQPHDFNLPLGSPLQARAAHAVFDRTLLRAGETVSMKLFLRQRTGTGFAIPRDDVPDRLRIRHRGSGDQYETILHFDSSGIAESSWAIPAGAKLGEYEAALYLGETWWGDCGKLQVEQFRVPTMKAELQPSSEVLVGPGPATFDLYVSYLSGGGASRLPVTLRTRVQPRVVSHPEYPGFSFGGRDVREGPAQEREEDGHEEGEAREAVRLVSAMPLTLNAAGSVRVSVPDIRPLDGPGELLAELEYHDANGERGVVARRVPLWPSRLQLGIQAEGWAAGRDRLRFQTVALDLAGKPVEGHEVAVELLHRKTTSYRKRMIGGFYAYEHQTKFRKLDTVCRGRTGKDGILDCDLAPKVSGGVVLRAVAADETGKAAVATREVWLAGDEEWWDEHAASDRMDLLPEQKSYEIGGKARLQVRMPFREATALVTVEREGVLDAFVTRLSGREPVLEVPLRPNYAPNVYISVLALRPRVPEPFGTWMRNLKNGNVKATAEHPVTATVDLNKPAYRLGMTSIDVGWAPYSLKVRLESDREVYQVRDKARVRITVTRPDGTPAPPGTEIVFAAVDEGLLELKPNESWQILERMMGRRGLEVRTATAQMQVVGKRHYGRKAVPHGGGGGRGAARELFDTLLMWQGRVALGDQGSAEIVVPLNDSLTSFRLVAVAHAGAYLFGTGQTSIRTSRDVMLHSGLAPLVREGDGFQAVFTVRNASQRPLSLNAGARVWRVPPAGTQRSEVAAQPASSVPAGPATAPDPAGEPRDLEPRSLTLAPGETQTLSWFMEVPPRCGQLRWEVAVESRDGSVQDLLRVNQRVTAPVPERVWQATLARVDRPLSLRVERPAGALAERGGVRVALRSRLADSLGGVRDHMSKYPYSCLEQRMSKAVALRDNGMWQEVLRDLPAHVDQDGLLKYFAVDTLRGSDVLTAYVLALSHESGWDIPQNLRRRMLEGLQGFVEGRLHRPGLTASADLVLRKLAALEALSRYDQAMPGMLEPLTISPQRWPTSALLDWCGILRRVRGIPQAEDKLRDAQRLLRARLILQGSVLGFSSERNDGLWWLMVSPDQNAARLILNLLEQPADERRQDLPRLVTGLVGRQKQGHWQTTPANAWGTLALEKFSAVYESEPVSGITGASLNRQHEDVDWQEAFPRPALEFPWPDEADALELRHQGSGAPWAVIQSRAAIPLSSPVAAGYRIERRLIPVEQRRPGNWSRGDVVRVHLSVEAAGDMTWVVIDDPVPAGASILGSGLGRDSRILTTAERPAPEALSPTFIERRFDAFRAYYVHMPAGRWTLEYTLRYNTPGQFQSPPTRVEALYAPEVFGEMPNLPLEIVNE